MVDHAWCEDQNDEATPSGMDGLYHHLYSSDYRWDSYNLSTSIISQDDFHLTGARHGIQPSPCNEYAIEITYLTYPSMGAATASYRKLLGELLQATSRRDLREART